MISALRPLWGAGTAQTEDFSPVSNFDISISAGSNQAEGTFDLTVIDDLVDDDDETLLVRGLTPLGLVVNPATITLVDNDEKGVTISETSLVVYEDGGTGTYTVKLESKPTGSVIIHIASSDESVATVSPASLSFDPDDTNNRIWSNPQTVTVTGVNDDIDNNAGNNPQRTADITHNVTSVDTVYHGMTVDSVNVTSQDDDGLPESPVVLSQSSLAVHGGNNGVSYTVQLESAPTASVTVELTSDDTSTATVSSASLIFEVDDTNDKIWSSPQTVTVTGVADSTSTTDRQTIISHQVTGKKQKTLPITVFYNLESVSEPDGDGSDLPRNNTTRGQVAVGGSATGSVIYERRAETDKDWFKVYFKSGRVYRIAVIGSFVDNSDYPLGGTLDDPALEVYDSNSTYVDENDDGDTGSNYFNSILDFAPSSEGFYYLSVNSAVDAGGTYTLFVEDRTLNPLIVQFSSNSYSVTEGDAVSVTATLDRMPGKTLIVPIVITNVDTDSSDYTTPISNTFFYYNEISSSQEPLVITAIDDSVTEGSETLRLGFGSLPPGVIAGPQNTATVTITD